MQVTMRNLKLFENYGYSAGLSVAVCLSTEQFNSFSKKCQKNYNFQEKHSSKCFKSNKKFANIAIMK